MKKQTRKLPTKADQRAFDFYWWHHRRNLSYRLHYAQVMKANPLVKELEAIRQKRALTKTEQSKLFKVASKSQEIPGKPGSYHWLPDPDITDSEIVMQMWLEHVPKYFQIPFWQQVKLRPFGPAAIWDPTGAGGEGRRNKPPLSQIGKELRSSMWSLKLTEEYLKAADCDMKAAWLVSEAKQSGWTVQEQKAVWQQEREQAIGKIRKLITEHPQMNFALDTSLRFGTIVEYLKSQWELVKELRESVGIKRDERPLPLRPRWRQQLLIWDKVRQLQPQGTPKFTNKFLKKLRTAQINKLNADVVMKRISPADYKREISKVRSEIRDAFLAAEKAIAETVK